MTAVRIEPARPVAVRGLAAETRRLAAAILLGVVAALALQVWIVGFLGRLGPEALYARAIYTPIGFVALAVHEGLAVVAQIGAGICRRLDRRSEAGRDLATLTLVGAGVFALLAGALGVAGGPILDAVGVAPADAAQVRSFLFLMCLANAAAIVPILCAGTLRGLGHARLSSQLSVVHVVVAAAAMLVLERFTDLGAQSVPVGYLGSTVLMGVLALVMLIGQGVARPDWRLSSDALRDIWRIGLPVAGSFLLLATVSSGYLHVLRHADPDQVTGFGLGQVVQTFLIVPATALGSAAAIAVTGRPAEAREALNRQGWIVLLRLATPVYAVIAAITLLLQSAIVHAVTDAPEIASSAGDYLRWVTPTLLLLGPTLAVLTYLEQIGRAGVALVLNVTFFAVVLGVALLLPQPVDDGALTHLIAIANVAGFCGVQFTVARRLRQPKEFRRARHRRPPARHRRRSRSRLHAR